MTGLVGEFSRNVDAKGRLSLPPKFREVLSAESRAERIAGGEEVAEDAPGKLVVTIDPHTECLYLFTAKGFEDWIDALFESKGGYDPRSRTHIKMRAKLASRAADVEIDSAGRINLATKQREEVGITKEVTLIGAMDYIQIWDSARWDEGDDDVDIESFFID